MAGKAGRSGRKPFPTALRLVTGNRSKKPLPANEPKPLPARMAPPPHLGEIAKEEWLRISDELAVLGILTKLDRAALATYCQAWERWVVAENHVREEAERKPEFAGMLIETTNGNMIQNPMVGIANKAMADIIKYAIEFGMTPSARSRIAAHRLAETKEDEAERFFG